jgi:glycosyltransferase involved in cell wall biosynthesis
LALFFSGSIGNRIGIPYIYYSLELIFRDENPYRYYQQKLKQERRYHRGAIATIVQDEFRAKALYAHNTVDSQPQIFVPIGMPTLLKMSSTHHWHRKYGLPGTSRIFLYFGNLNNEWRGLDKLVNAWAQCPHDFVLILHGNGDATEIKAYCEKHRLPHVTVSTDLVPEAMVRELICSADVGLCIYKNNPTAKPPALLERLTAVQH